MMPTWPPHWVIMIITTDRTVSDCLSVVSAYFIIELWKNIRVHHINTGSCSSFYCFGVIILCLLAELK